MTAPRSESTFSAPQANLELYGAVDEAIARALAAGDDETALRINRYLPGAIESPGWSNELRGLFGPEQQYVPSDDISATVAAALNGILSKSESDPTALTIPDLANLIYAIGTLNQIDAADPSGNTDLFVRALALAGIEEVTPDDKLRRAQAFLTAGLVGTVFTGWQAWPQIINEAADKGWIMKEIATVPQCSTSVVTVEGFECVALDAEIESDTITFDHLLAVVDPRNWPKAYPAFFCEMSGAAVRYPPDGWYNVRERVAFCPFADEFNLTQRLRFLKTDQRPVDARLDFDLAEDQTDCSRLVLVDRGFVNVTCTRDDRDTSKGGVRLKTRKVCHIKDISPFAQAFWLCKLGYGWAALNVFFGPAKCPPQPGWIGWEEEPFKEESKNDLGENDMGDGDAGDGDPGEVAAPPVGYPPADDKIEVVTKTAKRLAEVANYLTATNLDITKKWLSGNLEFKDLAKYGTDVGGKIASEPWKWLQDITKPTAPSEPPGGTP